MSSARRRESSADNGFSAADAGPAMESGSGDDDCSPSQYRKARLMHGSSSGVEESDRESDNGVESEGSVTSSEGSPSLHSSSADEYEDDEATYRKRFIEDEAKL